jgi:hypothetical protein
VPPEGRGGDDGDGGVSGDGGEDTGKETGMATLLHPEGRLEGFLRAKLRKVLQVEALQVEARLIFCLVLRPLELVQQAEGGT